MAQNDDRRLDRAQADLQDALYELNREVRAQYDKGGEDSFFSTIKKTLIGDDEEDPYYDSRQSYRPGAGYPPQRDYNPPRQGGGNYDYSPRPPQRPQPERTDRSYDYGAASPRQNYGGDRPPVSNPRSGNGAAPRRPDARPPRRPAEDPYEQRNVSRKYYSEGKGRNIPYENDWDEDDEWF